MQNNPQRIKIEEILTHLRDRLNTIAKLQKEVSSLKKAEEELVWMLRAEDNSPAIVWPHQSENLLSRLVELDDFIDQNSLPYVKPDFSSFVYSAGTISSSDYIRHVNKLGNAFLGNNDVRDWVLEVSNSYHEFRVKQETAKLVASRLKKLKIDLFDLHQSAINTCWSAFAGTQSPIESAATLRELLDQFKGALINICQRGNKATYQRIADNLAFESLKSLISDQQEVYDDLHAELSKIAKSRLEVPLTRMQELLSLTENHILAVTIGLDPEKIGFEFYSD